MNEKFVALTSGSLLEVLERQFPDSSRRTLKSWILNGRILLGDEIIDKPHSPIEKNTSLSFGFKKIMLSQEIQILYEDRDLVVIDKPEGLLSVATPYEKGTSAHEILKQMLPRQRVYPVHRLDRDTSGVLLFALSYRAQTALKEAFAHRSLSREYLAIVEGILDEKEGSWSCYLEEGAGFTMHPNSKGRGKFAKTLYQTLHQSRSYSCLKVTLETGRKNQIRAHAQMAGHPIAGDSKYGSKSNPLGRLGLHAKMLGFTHPFSGKKLVFTSPAPKSFKNFMEKS